VNLDGVEAWLFSSSQDWTVVTWLEDGVITALQGEGGREETLALAKQLRRVTGEAGR
ncbi:MAG: hypothetical protein IRY95_09905, partial [Clostridia bacterium]|nr:hypothetical protein [Clostridia bacterium]